MMFQSITPTSDRVCARVPWCRPAVLNALLDLAIEIAREGREGRRKERESGIAASGDAFDATVNG